MRKRKSFSVPVCTFVRIKSRTEFKKSLISRSKTAKAATTTEPRRLYIQMADCVYLVG
jgi:hypothetical protein